MAEVVGELLNFCQTEEKREILLEKATSNLQLRELMVNFSREIKEEQFDPISEGCHGDYDFYRYHVVENYLSYEPDQFILVGEVSSDIEPTLCIDVGSRDRVVLWPCRAQPLTVMDNHLLGFTKNGAIMLTNWGCFDTYGRTDDGSKLEVSYCHSRSPDHGTPGDRQRFEFSEVNKWILNPIEKRCLTVFMGGEEGWELGMFPCDTERVDQRWTLKIPSWFR
eukprot:sb/3469761/